MANINLNILLDYAETRLTNANASDVKIYINGVANDATYTASAWRVALSPTAWNAYPSRFPVRVEGKFGDMLFDSEEITITRPTAHVTAHAFVGASAPHNGIENPRFVTFPPFPKAENVPEAAGDAPTAAEFKALLDALIDAGLMEAAATE